MRFLRPKLNRFAEELYMRLYAGIDLDDVSDANGLVHMQDQELGPIIRRPKIRLARPGVV